MRYVYPTTEVIHKWAHQTQESARNAGRTVYFTGPTLYSYGSHFPMGHIHRVKGRAAPLVLLNSQRYSATTAKHMSWTQRAVSHMNAIAVPYPTRGGDGDRPNLNYLLNCMAEESTKCARAMTASMAESRASTARSYHSAAEQYCAFFKVRRKLPDLPDFAPMIQRAQRIENPDPASADKRERARAQRAAAKLVRDTRAAELRELHNAAARSDWRLGHPFGGMAVRYAPAGPCMLRVRDDEIQTSQGASIPLASAPMVWALVERTRLTGGGRTFQGHIKIGDYAVNEITADGDLRVGCHTIPHSELRSMARALARLGLLLEGRLMTPCRFVVYCERAGKRFYLYDSANGGAGFIYMRGTDGCAKFPRVAAERIAPTVPRPKGAGPYTITEVAS